MATYLTPGTAVTNGRGAERSAATWFFAPLLFVFPVCLGLAYVTGAAWFSALALLLALTVYFGLAALVGRSAARRGRSGTAWFVIASFFLLPSWVIVMCMADPRRQSSAPSLVAPAPDIPHQIQRLADLHAGGSLTTTEFEVKKAELLGRL